MNYIKLYFSLFVAIALSIGCAGPKKKDVSEQETEKRPNIIYIYTDQQSATMMSCSGNKWLKTPAMDYLAENGMRFTRAYSTNPVCSPARVSMVTGRFPSVFNGPKGKEVRENHGSIDIPTIPEEVKMANLGTFMQKSGYDLHFGGKRHLPPPLLPSKLGFNFYTDDERDDLVEKTVKLIKSEHEKPYFLIVSLINPHDICYYGIRDYPDSLTSIWLSKADEELKMLDSAMQIPEGVTEEEFFAKYCPPLPPNYEPQEDEPEAVKSLIEQRYFRQKIRENYTDEQWRKHRWAYHRLTEMVDKQIQLILDALKESGQEENTLVMFSSDHGDMDAAHRMEHKSTMYEEAANIPFIAMWKGHIKPGQVDSESLISNGLDFLPTVCDYAGVEGATDPRGKSLRPLFEGKATKWRNTLGVESEIGRMVVSKDKYKYVKYDFAGTEEQLLDLNKDPYETTHFTDNPEYSHILDSLRNDYETFWFPGK